MGFLGLHNRGWVMTFLDCCFLLSFRSLLSYFKASVTPRPSLNYCTPIQFAYDCHDGKISHFSFLVSILSQTSKAMEVM